MAELLPSLISGSLPRIGQKPAVNGGMRAWLDLGRFVPELPESGYIASFQIENLDELIHYICHDFERFALSSMESFASASEKSIISASWQLLKAYYAGFFAAHAIMRFRGSGIVKIDQKQTKKAKELGDLYGIDLSAFNGGNYFYQVTENDDGIPFIHWRVVDRGAGVHDSFWREFCQFLGDDAAAAASSDLPNASEYIAGNAELSMAIRSHSGNGIWLSSFRNDINYRHLHGVWIPISKKVTRIDIKNYISYKNSGSFRLDISKVKNPIQSFLNTVLFLSCLNIEICRIVAANSTEGKAFGQKYRYAIENLAKAIKLK